MSVTNSTSGHASTGSSRDFKLVADVCEFEELRLCYQEYELGPVLLPRRKI